MFGECSVSQGGGRGDTEIKEKEVQHQVIIYYITSGQEDVEFMKEKGKGMQWVWNNLFGVM